MDSALTPRDIQARIRSGESLEDVAKAAGVPMENVEPFAAPVIAERAHVAGMALASPVRRRGESASVRAMRAVVNERLQSRGIDSDDVIWDAWRLPDRRWTVRGHYRSGSATHEPEFLYDQRGRFSVAANDDARWLIGEATSAHGPQPGRRRSDPDSEPTIDLDDEWALVRAVQETSHEPTARVTIASQSGPKSAADRRSQRGAIEAGSETDLAQAEPDVAESATSEARTAESETSNFKPSEMAESEAVASATVESGPAGSEAAASPPVEHQRVESETDESGLAADVDGLAAAGVTELADYAPAELTEVNGVYDIVPAQRGDMDLLYDMLSSFNEDSVNIYAGLTGPGTPASPDWHEMTEDDATRFHVESSRQTVSEESTGDLAPGQPGSGQRQEPNQPSANDISQESRIGANEPNRAGEAPVEAGEAPVEAGADERPTRTGDLAKARDLPAPAPTAASASARVPATQRRGSRQTTRRATVADNATSARTPTQTEATAGAEATTAADVSDQPALVDQVDEGVPPAASKTTRKRGRATVPSWDEIMFGAPLPGSRNDS